MPSRPMGSDALHQDVEVERRSPAEVRRVRSRLRRTLPFLSQHGLAEFGHGFAGHPMDPHADPLRPFGVARLRQLPQQGDQTEPFSSTALKETSFRRSRISRADLG